MLIPLRLDKYSYDSEQPTTYKILLNNKNGMNAQKSVYYGFHSRIFQCSPASRMCLNFVNTKEARLRLDD